MGKLYVTATPIGNLKDISQRALEVLQSCDLIAAEDTRHTLKLLNFYNIKNRLISYHEFNERERARQLIAYMLEKDMDIALVSDAGTPCIADPGYRIVSAAREKGIEVISVPGPSAIAAALSISGLPTDQFSFYGFLPEKAERKAVLKDIRNKRIRTFILYESPKRIRDLARDILDEFPNARVCVCCDLTKLHEKSIRGPIAEVARRLQEDPKAELGEYTVIVYNDYEEEEKARDGLSVEALIVDMVVKKRCSLKEAVRLVAEKHNLPRREVYRGAIELKGMISTLGNPDL